MLWALEENLPKVCFVVFTRSKTASARAFGCFRIGIAIEQGDRFNRAMELDPSDLLDQCLFVQEHLVSFIATLGSSSIGFVLNACLPRLYILRFGRSDLSAVLTKSTNGQPKQAEHLKMSNSENTASIGETNIEVKSINDPVKNKRRILLKLLGYSGLFGVYSVFLPYINPVLNFLVCLPLLGLCFSWCHVDSNQRGYAMGKLMRIGLILVFLLAFPFYLLRTRGFGG